MREKQSFFLLLQHLNNYLYNWYSFWNNQIIFEMGFCLVIQISQMLNLFQKVQSFKNSKYKIVYPRGTGFSGGGPRIPSSKVEVKNMDVFIETMI